MMLIITLTSFSYFFPKNTHFQYLIMLTTYNLVKVESEIDISLGFFWKFLESLLGAACIRIETANGGVL